MFPIGPLNPFIVSYKLIRTSIYQYSIATLLSFILFTYNFVKEHNLKRNMVDKVGLEPTTSRVSDVCTDQLCYLSIGCWGTTRTFASWIQRPLCYRFTTQQEGSRGWVLHPTGLYTSSRYLVAEVGVAPTTYWV